MLFNIHLSLNTFPYTHANLHINDFIILLNVNASFHILGYKTMNVYVSVYIFFHIKCNFLYNTFLRIHDLNVELTYLYGIFYYNTNIILHMDDH